MTEPTGPATEPAAGGPREDLVATVASLAGRVEELHALLSSVARGLTGEVDELRGVVNELANQVEGLEPVATAADEPAVSSREAPPRAWVDRASVDDWEALAAWVDWLVTTYDVLSSRAVLPCWPAHLGVAEELAALWTAWQASAGAAQGQEPTVDLADWHSHYLTGTLVRLREAYQVRSCEDEHKKPRNSRLTDRSLLQTVERLEEHPGLHPLWLTRGVSG